MAALEFLCDEFVLRSNSLNRHIKHKRLIPRHTQLCARWPVILLCFLTAETLWAHEVQPGPFHELRWAWEPGILIPLVLSGGWYIFGLWKFWAGAKTGRGIH